MTPSAPSAVSVDIIKTWPGFMTREVTRRVFSASWARFYFSLGRGRPKRTVANIYMTHQGQILGSFPIEEIVQNDGQLPTLRSLQDRESAWQFKRGVWVAVCVPPCHWLHEEVFHESFRGWRYFDLAEYRQSEDALVNLEAAG